MTPVVVLCILLCAASAAPSEKRNLPADVSEPQEEMMRMMIKEEEQELPEDLLPELRDGAEFQEVEDPEARFTPCPVLWYLHSGVCYMSPNLRRTWFDAAEYCFNHGAQLASVTSASQYSVLQQLVRSINPKSCWLGGLYTQDQWMWTDGQSFSYNGWDDQKTPSSNPCIILDVDDGWTNAECTDSNYFICARKARL